MKASTFCLVSAVDTNRSSCSVLKKKLIFLSGCDEGLHKVSSCWLTFYSFIHGERGIGNGEWENENGKLKMGDEK